MTSPLVHFIGLLSGTAPFNQAATPIDTLPQADQVIAGDAIADIKLQPHQQDTVELSAV